MGPVWGLGERGVGGERERRVLVKWMKRAEVSEVTMAAELPRPVLCTFPIGTPRGAKGMGVASYKVV